MKKLVFLFTMLCAGVSLLAQDPVVIFEDNFDSYTAGQTLCTQNNNWSVWDGGTDPEVSTEQAETTPNSVKIAHNGTDDLIYQFGNKSSGQFMVEFDFYVPGSGNGAYFNFLHNYAGTSSVWAFSCNFHNTGGGSLNVGNVNVPFTNNVNEWFHVTFEVDIDADEASMKFENTVVHTWPFTYSETSTGIVPTSSTLSAVDFFASTPTQTAGTYYVDNFKFTQLREPDPGVLVVTPTTAIEREIESGKYAAYNQITVTNSGSSPLSYRIVPVYELDEVDPTSSGIETLSHHGGLTTAIMSNSDHIMAAICLHSNMFRTHIGRSVRSITVDLLQASYAITAKAMVMGMNEGGMIGNGPGEVIAEQIFTPVEGPNVITLDNPVIIDGSDIWVSILLTFTPTEDQSARPCISVDEKNAFSEYGDWISHDNGETWGHLSIGDGLFHDWIISVTVDGTRYTTPWITTTPEAGSLLKQQGSNVSVSLGNTRGVREGVNNATLFFFSSQVGAEPIEIPIMVNFYTMVNFTTVSGQSVLPDVNITVSGEGNEFTITSDNAGKISNRLDAGNYTYVASKDGYISVEGTIEMTGQNKDIKLDLAEETGINEEENTLSLYPNPVENELTISRSATNNMIIEIYNTNGAIVNSFNMSENIKVISVNEYPSGVYFVKMTNNNEVIVKRFVKK